MVVFVEVLFTVYGICKRKQLKKITERKLKRYAFYIYIATFSLMIIQDFIGLSSKNNSLEEAPISVLMYIAFVTSLTACLRQESKAVFFTKPYLFMLLGLFPSLGHEIINHDLSINLLWVSLIAYIVVLSVILGLLCGYYSHEQKSAWMRFRIWHAICVAAHLERPAIASVIGEKALRLLE